MPFLTTKVSELQDIRRSSLDLCYREWNPAAPMGAVCAMKGSLQFCHLTSQGRVRWAQSRLPRAVGTAPTLANQPLLLPPIRAASDLHINISPFLPPLPRPCFPFLFLCLTHCLLISKPHTVSIASSRARLESSPHVSLALTSTESCEPLISEVIHKLLQFLLALFSSILQFAKEFSPFSLSASPATLQKIKLSMCIHL